MYNIEIVVFGFYALMYIGWTVVNITLAQEKNIPQAGIFFGSLFLTPLVMWCYVSATHRREK